MLSRPMINRFIFGGVSWYAVLIVLSILAGYQLATREARRQRLSDDLIVDFLLLAIPLGIIGARLYYVFFRWNDYSDD
ncbi:MAG: prolipoprotein diacylglyceryl transferase, partial [Clostridia bacterium]|nr:prolipoprotein diacylglyceryl transferase [Clostridia bacterium]